MRDCCLVRQNKALIFLHQKGPGDKNCCSPLYKTGFMNLWAVTVYESAILGDKSAAFPSSFKSSGGCYLNLNLVAVLPTPMLYLQKTAGYSNMV